MQKSRRASLRANLMLLLAALIWGTTFVAQSEAMSFVQPFTFNFARNIVGCAVLLPCIRITDAVRRKNGEQSMHSDKKTLWRAGFLCGLALFAASSLQQTGIAYSTVGKAGFITTLYIVLVPLLGLFRGSRLRPIGWMGVALASIGLNMLCVGEGFTVAYGDILLLGCALCYAVHILVVDKYSPYADGVRMSCIQFFVTAVLSGVCMFIFEQPDINAVLNCTIPILYSGGLSCGVAFTLQILAQKDISPAAAAITMSLESVIAALSGWIILGETLSFTEITGCVLMFAAVILVQLPGMKRTAE